MKTLKTLLKKFMSDLNAKMKNKPRKRSKTIADKSLKW
jgi:hypothetical protein